MRRNLVFSIVLVICLAARTLVADTVVIPSDYTSTEAGSSDNAPLGASEQHFQQVYSSSLLTALNVGDVIDGIGFRVEGGESAVPAQTITTYNISMSTAALPPGSLSTTFSDNRGSDFQTVRSGPLTVTAATFPGGSSPNGFGWIPFTTPYVYKGGNLLIEVAYQGFVSGRDSDAVYPYASGLAQTAFGNGYSATTADAGIYDEAIVMGFSIVPVVSAVPEPSELLLFGSGLVLLGATCRKKLVG